MGQISSQIKQIRSLLHITQKQFAARLGVTGAHISAIEKGKTQPSAALVKLINKEFSREFYIMNQKKAVDFQINSAPVSISFDCPYCGDSITLPWKSLNPPDYWGDRWDEVECPDCGKMVELQDYEYM